MLPSLYFPQEHLYAVYSPFFLPTAIPVRGGGQPFAAHGSDKGHATIHSQVLSALMKLCKKKKKQKPS